VKVVLLTNILIILVENTINVCRLRDIKHPKLHIAATQNKNSVSIQIIDNLGGVKEKNIDDIFKKNHSVSSSTGLGLYLVKEFLIPKLDGEISVENIDNGAKFVIKL